MIHSSPFIVDLALIMITAAITILLCKYLKQPVVLGYLLAGFFVGPNFPLIPTVSEISSVDVWAEFGVIFLLFTLGFSFKIKTLLSVGSTSIIITLIKNLVMFSTGPIIAYLFNLTTLMGLFIGAIISLTSTIAVARSLEDFELTQKPFSSVVMGVLIVEDVLTLLIILLISTLGSSETLSGLNLASSFVLKFLFVGFVFTLSIYLPRLIVRINKLLSKEMTIITSLAFCLAIAMLSAKVGLSPALGAFIAGMLLSETTESTSIIKLILPIRDLFVAIFFISVGMMIKPSVLLENWQLILVLSFVMILLKGISTALASMLAGQNKSDSSFIGTLLIPIGEFSFVIATLGISMEVISQDIYSIAVTLSAISILGTNYLIKYLPKLEQHYLEKTNSTF